MVAIHDQQVLMNDRRTTITMRAAKSTRTRDPLLFALHVVGCYDHIADRDHTRLADVFGGLHRAVGLKKRDINRFSIRDGRSRCVTVQLVFALQHRPNDSRLPSLLTILPVETHQDAFIRFFDASRYKDLIVPHNR